MNNTATTIGKIGITIAGGIAALGGIFALMFALSGGGNTSSSEISAGISQQVEADAAKTNAESTDIPTPAAPQCAGVSTSSTAADRAKTLKVNGEALSQALTTRSTSKPSNPTPVVPSTSEPSSSTPAVPPTSKSTVSTATVNPATPTPPSEKSPAPELTQTVTSPTETQLTVPYSLPDISEEAVFKIDDIVVSTTPSLHQRTKKLLADLEEQKKHFAECAEKTANSKKEDNQTKSGEYKRLIQIYFDATKNRNDKKKFIEKLKAGIRECWDINDHIKAGWYCYGSFYKDELGVYINYTKRLIDLLSKIEREVKNG